MRRFDVEIETKSSSISSSINSSWPMFIQTKFSDEVVLRRIQTKSSSLYKYGHYLCEELVESSGSLSYIYLLCGFCSFCT